MKKHWLFILLFLLFVTACSHSEDDHRERYPVKATFTAETKFKLYSLLYEIKDSLILETDQTYDGICASSNNGYTNLFEIKDFNLPVNAKQSLRKLIIVMTDDSISHVSCQDSLNFTVKDWAFEKTDASSFELNLSAPTGLHDFKTSWMSFPGDMIGIDGTIKFKR